jgi:uncharacterized membrane protein YfcA
MIYTLAGIAVAIGILLGLLGGGGSILTVPALVYLAGMTAKSAIVTSLIVVGITSTIAVIDHARRKHVCWKTGFVFAFAGMFGAFLGGRLTAHIPDAILLLLFALVMLGAALAMLVNRKVKAETRLPGEPFCPVDLPVAAILFDGFMVGMVTGLVGVGGGFLLVPALNFFAGLPIHAAIGTSLLIIVLQSGAALLGHASHFAPDWPLTGFFTGFAVCGSFIGGALSAKIGGPYLKKGFGAFVLALGFFLLYRETDAAMLRQIEALFLEHRTFILGMLSSLALIGIYRLWVWVHTLR